MIDGPSASVDPASLTAALGDPEVAACERMMYIYIYICIYPEVYTVYV